MKDSALRVLAVSSGKGGVGKTNVVANLAYALSKRGKKVLVVDADLGLNNIDILLGLAPKYHIGHVLSGDKSVEEILVQGPAGIRVLPAGDGLRRKQLTHVWMGAPEPGFFHAGEERIEGGIRAFGELTGL